MNSKLTDTIDGSIESQLLRKRVLREKIAYDNTGIWQSSDEIHRLFHHVFECPNTMRGESHFDNNLAQLCNNATVLDYGCLDGCLAPKYVSLGAGRVIGVDISERYVSKARAAHGNIAEFHVCEAHAMQMIQDASIDVVVGRSILHHLEFSVAVKEVLRVLKTGGHALFVEPLFDNPASMLFRRLTPAARTADERPLSRKQIETADGLFSLSDHQFCNLTTTPVAMATSLLPVKADNLLLRVCDVADNHLASTRWRYWMRVVYLHWTK
jgi:SAM-dependent methyltransferase